MKHMILITIAFLSMACESAEQEVTQFMETKISMELTEEMGQMTRCKVIEAVAVDVDYWEGEMFCAADGASNAISFPWRASKVGPDAFIWKMNSNEIETYPVEG